MASKPTVGGSDGTWGTELNAYLAVAHNTDGTHNATQTITDLGWSPVAYAGEESVTFPNGLIFKQGLVGSLTANPQVITFAVAFPNGVLTPNAIPKDTSGLTPTDGDVLVSVFLVTKMEIYIDLNTEGYFWQAWGW